MSFPKGGHYREVPLYTWHQTKKVGVCFKSKPHAINTYTHIIHVCIYTRCVGTLKINTLLWLLSWRVSLSGHRVRLSRIALRVVGLGWRVTIHTLWAACVCVCAYVYVCVCVCVCVCEEGEREIQRNVNITVYNILPIQNMSRSCNEPIHMDYMTLHIINYRNQTCASLQQ